MGNRILYGNEPGGESTAAQPWSSPAEFDPAWMGRIRRMAGYIRPGASVADFGCGPMWLKTCLPPGTAYIGIDYVARDEHTLTVDLNKGPWPRLQADVAFLSGILEYVADVRGLGTALIESGFRQVILSYCTLEKFGDLQSRKDLNWVSHLSIFDLLDIFLRAYDLRALDDYNRNTILVFERKAK